MASRSFVQWRAPPGRHGPRPLHGVWVDGRRDGSWGEWWVGCVHRADVSPRPWSRWPSPSMEARRACKVGSAAGVVISRNVSPDPDGAHGWMPNEISLVRGRLFPRLSSPSPAPVPTTAAGRPAPTAAARGSLGGRSPLLGRAVGSLVPHIGPTTADRRSPRADLATRGGEGDRSRLPEGEESQGQLSCGGGESVLARYAGEQPAHGLPERCTFRRTGPRPDGDSLGPLPPGWEPPGEGPLSAILGRGVRRPVRERRGGVACRTPGVPVRPRPVGVVPGAPRHRSVAGRSGDRTATWNRTPMTVRPASGNTLPPPCPPGSRCVRRHFRLAPCAVPGGPVPEI